MFTFTCTVLSSQAYFHFPGEAEFLMSPSPRSKAFKLFTTKMIISAIFTQIKAMGNRDLNNQFVSNKTVLYIMNALFRPTEGAIAKCGRQPVLNKEVRDQNILTSTIRLFLETGSLTGEKTRGRFYFHL